VPQVLGGKVICVMVLPPYSPDLSPADFRLFPKIKSVLKGKRFLNAEDIKSHVKKKIDELSLSGF
jgi:transposase